MIVLKHVVSRQEPGAASAHHNVLVRKNRSSLRPSNPCITFLLEATIEFRDRLDVVPARDDRTRLAQMLRPTLVGALKLQAQDSTVEGLPLRTAMTTTTVFDRGSSSRPRETIVVSRILEGTDGGDGRALELVESAPGLATRHTHLKTLNCGRAVNRTRVLCLFSRL